jgi:RND superfamily putative drug exporter
MTKNKLLRIIIPIVLVIIWFGLVSVGGPTFGKISSVTTNDQAAFLPNNAESTMVQKLQNKYQTNQAVPAIVVIESDDQLTNADISQYATLNGKMSNVKGVESPVIGPIPSRDLKAIEFIVPINSTVKTNIVVGDLKNIVDQGVSNGDRGYVAGPAGLIADLVAAFGGIDGILLIVALVAVFVILLAVYKSVLLPILVLINAMFALSVAILVVYLMAKNGIIELSGQSQGILSILVIGAATDYSLLLVSRYREALIDVSNKWEAIIIGIKRSFEPIVASAVTVILAMLCLLFSDLNSNRSLGPVAATGIVFSLLATLTFLPALLVLFGKTSFWPSRIKGLAGNQPVSIETGKEELAGVWKYVGNLISLHARRVWIVTVVILAVSSIGLLQLKASGVSQTDYVLSQSDAADGQKAIARHFDAGIGAPVLVATAQSSLGSVLPVIRSDAELTDISVYGKQGLTNNLADAKVVDGQILISATLQLDPYSPQAESAIKKLRSDLSAESSGALVGGTTAIALDTNNTAITDLRKIVPIVLVVIFIVLAVLLRSLLAPLLLILTVVFSFSATMGISAFVFNHIFNFPGADATVPLFGFVFLVALGIDYNIFLISRAREEAAKYGTRAAMLHSLGKTGGVITSAGVVLASTFAALGIIPILFLAQIAFIVAFGVLLDTVIVRSLLVPALFYDIGPKVWWLSKKSR